MLNAGESKHARDALRLEIGTEIEVFDDAGRVARGVIIELSPSVQVRVQSRAVSQINPVELTIAAAVPKGERADWMIEKLSELGVARFVPLATDRSVVLPEGRNKRERWLRIANESAKQSRRAGVIKIDQLTPLDRIVGGDSIYLSTQPDARPLLDAIAGKSNLTLVVGPEGGWSDREMARFTEAKCASAKLTTTILRVETAAIAAAAAVMIASASNPP